MTARAEAFQPGHLTWRALASRRHCVIAYKTEFMLLFLILFIHLLTMHNVQHIKHIQ